MIVTTRKIPFRISLRDRRPIVVEITVRNNAGRERKYVANIETDSNLSLSPSGLARYGEKKTKTLFPGEVEVIAFKVYPRSTTRPGRYPVRITIDECLDSYDNIINTKTIILEIPVD